jgi:hypothetical protein
MKKYIREMISDLRTSRKKDFIPSLPKDATKESVKDLTPPPAPVVPNDLSKQLDYQAFESERLQTDE